MTVSVMQLTMPGMAGIRRSTTPKQFLEDVLRRTKEARKRARMDRKKIADLLGIEVENYKKFETRSPIAIHLLIPFCDATGTDPYELLTGKPFRIGRPIAALPADDESPLLNDRKVAT